MAFFAAVAALMALCAPFASAAAPGNDDFDDREMLGSTLPVSLERSNAEATKEAGESIGGFAAGHSVWFEWTAPVTGFVTIGSCDSGIGTVLGIFTGTTIGGLTKVVDGNKNEGPHCRNSGREYTFKATVGTSYAIAVDGNGFYPPLASPPVTEGAISLRIEATPPPSNDDFETAAALDGRITEEPKGARRYIASVSGYTWNATKQGGEPTHAGDLGGSSVWYMWTAPESGLARFSACCGSPNLIGVYAGDMVGALTELGSGKGLAQVFVSVGTTYRIAVDSEFSLPLGGPSGGSFDFLTVMELAPGPGYLVGADGGGAGPFTPAASDLVAPRTTIIRKKIRPKAGMASFVFASSERGSSYQCRLDGRKAAPCKSPKSYAGLSSGQHTFRVTAIDMAGNADPSPASARFRIAKPKSQ